MRQRAPGNQSVTGSNLTPRRFSPTGSSFCVRLAEAPSSLCASVPPDRVPLPF